MTDGQNLSAADVAAVMGGNRMGGFGGYGGYGDGGIWWILILFLFAMMGGWGNNNGNNGGGGWGNNFYGAVPYIGQQSEVQRGFDQQAIMSGISGLQTSVSNGFHNAEVAECNRAMQNMQAMNTLGMSLQNCCCENRAGLADLKYTVAQENCLDRQVVNDGFRDSIVANNANTQRIIDNANANSKAVLDKLCQLELDGLKQKIADQQAEITALRGGISQTAQTAQLLQDNAAQTANLLQRLNPTPVPAYIMQNPNCCQNTCGCNTGCGCN